MNDAILMHLRPSIDAPLNYHVICRKEVLFYVWNSWIYTEAK